MEEALAVELTRLRAILTLDLLEAAGEGELFGNK
jgi:hypothetical protein